MRAAAADLDFEEAARLRDEIKRLRSTELAVLDDPTAKFLPAPAAGDPAREPRRGGASNASRVDRPHKPHLDEMGIATWHEFAPSKGRAKPHKPTLDEMGPGVEAIPAKPRDAQEAGSAGGATGTQRNSPRSTLGRPGMRGGWKPRRR